MRIAFLLIALSLLPAPALAQLRVTSPYLDVVERYRSGDHVRAVDEVIGFPSAGIRERARRDLTDLPCQILTGIADCAKAREAKPREFERVFEVWTTTLPVAAGLHIDAAVAAQKAGRLDAATAHQHLALEIADWLVTTVPATVEGVATRTAMRRQVWLLSVWLLQLRLELKELELLLIRARQAFPNDALLLLASGAFHEVQARPYLLLESSEGRQGNLAAWRQNERTWRLKSAEEGYRAAVAADAALAEGFLRLGRVLTLEGRSEEGRVEFGRVAGLTKDARWQYLALAFQAASFEADGKNESAEPAYRAALELWPASQSARMGLSRAQAERGDWTAARTELDALTQHAEDLEKNGDPWWAYDFGQAWRIESGLAELRKLASR